MIKTRQLGFLKISVGLFNSNPEVTAEVISQLKFFPLSCDGDKFGEYFEMEGYSPFFKSISYGEELPHYNLVVRDMILNGHKVIVLEKIINERGEQIEIG